MIENAVVRDAALALRAGKIETAVRLVLSLGPEEALSDEARFVWGLAELAREAWPEAHRLFARLAKDKPDCAPFAFNLALAEEKLGHVDEALRLMEKCLALGPASGEVYGNLSNLYRAKGRYAEAEEAARLALEKGAPREAALNCRALALAAMGQREKAEALWAEALAGGPGDADIWANRANAAADDRAFDEALADFARARALRDDPAFRRDEGMIRLLMGDAERGAALYEARLDVPRAFAPPPVVPRWRGEDLAGKTLALLSEQGLGDTIQFCRYGKILAEKGASLVWSVQPPLVALLQGQVPGRVIERFAPVRADFYLPLVSLPFALGAASSGAPYLNAPRAAQGGRKRVGLIWAGASAHRRDAERSVPLRALAPLWSALPEVAFCAPFKGPALAEIEACAAPVQNLEARLSDFRAAAAAIAELDAVVSVDTAGAHLAGALGVPTCVLLPFVPDWRWGVAGTRTPLYDSLVLCRQSVRGRWEEPISEALRFLGRVL